MVANILHFGEELDDRFPLLRNAGFSIKLFESLADFRGALESRADHDALSVPDLPADLSRDVIQAARTYSSAPLILFRTVSVTPFRAGTAAETGTDFDLVVPASPPSGWITDVAALIARGRALCAESQRIQQESLLLREEARKVIEQSAFERERARLLRAEDTLGGAMPTSFADKVLTCAKCGAEFVFTAEEQFFFQQRNFTNDPKVCKKCRSQRRKGGPRTHPEFTVKCAECGILTSVPFKPTQGRPVLCRFCFEKRGMAT